jgi:hypothetical protein
MATGLSITLRQAQMDYIFQGATPTQPSTIAVGLKTADPSDDNSTGTEPSSTGSYARVTFSAGTTNWNAATSTAGSASTVTNKIACTFPASTAAWSTTSTALSFAILMSSATLGSGTFYGRASLTASQTVNASGITLSFAATQFSWTNSFT